MQRNTCKVQKKQEGTKSSKEGQASRKLQTGTGLISGISKLLHCQQIQQACKAVAVLIAVPTEVVQKPGDTVASKGPNVIYIPLQHHWMKFMIMMIRFIIPSYSQASEISMVVYGCCKEKHVLLTCVQSSSTKFLRRTGTLFLSQNSNSRYTRAERYCTPCPAAAPDIAPLTQHLEERVICKVVCLLPRSPYASIMHQLYFATSVSLLFPIFSDCFCSFKQFFLFLHICLSDIVRDRLSLSEQDLETTDCFYSNCHENGQQIALLEEISNA